MRFAIGSLAILFATSAATAQTPATLTVVVDGTYRIVLALSDLDSSLGGRRILLADRVDGKPLPPTRHPGD